MATTTVTSGKRTIKDGTGADTYNIAADATSVTIAGSMSADTINVEGLASDYMVSASGRTITLKSDTQTIKFQLKAGSGTATVAFLDGSLTAAVSAKGATLGTQKLSKKAVEVNDAAMGAADSTAVDFTGTGSGGSSSGGSSSGVAGSTFTMSTNLDVVKGTSGNDTILGDDATIVSADQVDGGNGTDTMKIYTLAAATDVPTLTNVENLELYDANLPAAFSVADTADLAQLTLSNPTNADTVDISAAQKVTLSGMADGEAVTVTSTATDTTHDLTITNMGTIAGAGVTVNADGASITTVNISASGSVAASTDSDITLASTGTETTVNLTGSGDLALATAASVVTLAASGYSGNLTYVSGATTTATAITTGGGGDTVTATAAVDYNINLGDGNDTLITADAVGELTAADSITGGNGTDVIGVVSAVAADLDDDTSADEAILARLTGFERLRITDNLADNFDISTLGFNYLQLADDVITGGGTTVTVSGFTSGATVEFRDGADMTDTLVVTMTGANAAGSSSDTLNLTLNANLAATNDFEYNVAISGINIVNITASDRDNSDLATDGDGDGYTIDLDGDAAGADANLSTVNITGAAQVTYSVTATADALALIDASTATGVQVISAAAFNGTQGLSIKGGSLGDTLTGAPSLGDLINGGAGNDTINGGTGSDIYTGGSGTDSFNFTRAASYTGGAPSASVFDEITDYVKGADIINETGGALALSTDASQVSTAAGTAAISLTTGIATFNTADDTLAEKIVAVNAGLAAGTEAHNQFAIFEHSGSTYIYIYDNTADTVGAEDGLIKLTGITGITTVDLTTSTGNLILS